MKFKAPKSVFRATLYGCCRHIVRQLKDRVGLIVPKPSNNAGLLGESIHNSRPKPFTKENEILTN